MGPAVAGIAGAPVRALDVGRALAWVSTVAAGDRAADAAALVAHEAVTAAALRRATPLPVRFGQRFATDDDCRRALRERAAAIEARLADVAGCVEMRVLLAPAERADAPPSSAGAAERPETGRAYLERIRSRLHGERALHERGAALRAALGAALAPLPRRDALAVRPGTGAPVAVAHLIARGDADIWRERAGRLLPSLREGGERALVSGPVAPWSFAELADAGAE